MKVIEVRNLGKYQHYKDRPDMPWIKWYKKCLNDSAFRKLKNGERWLFIGLIILATWNDNKVPYNCREIAQTLLNLDTHPTHVATRKTRQSIKKMEKLNLISIKTISECYQLATHSREEKIREEKNGSFKYKFDKSSLGKKMTMLDAKGRTEAQEEAAKEMRRSKQ